MQITISTKQILNVLHVLSYIIFIGVCIEAGGFIFNTIFTLALNPVGAQKFWSQVNLNSLYYFNQSHFVVLTSYMIIVAVLRAILFYLIIKMLHNKKFSLQEPFNPAMQKFIFNMSYLSIGIGLFSFLGSKFTGWLSTQGVEMPDVEQLRLGGADVWLFMGITLLVIGHIFKRGVEMQAENELTI